MRRTRKKRLKLRYIAASLAVAASVAVTPYCVDAAYRMRGYMAYGGEWLVVPLGIVVAAVILESAKIFDVFRAWYEDVRVESESPIGSAKSFGMFAESEE